MSLLPLLGLAALAGLSAAWLTVLLLVFPGRPTWRVQGFVNQRAQALADFAAARLLVLLPSPARFFEQLGPDRFRREFLRHLRLQVDGHVDEMMDRRNALAWGSLSVYARTRVYSHVERRLPFAVDNFVDQVHRDLDHVINTRGLVHRYFSTTPAHAGQIFLAAFGEDLRARLPFAALAGAGAGWLCAGLVAGIFQLAAVLGVAAFTGSLSMLVVLAWPARARVVWPVRLEGIVYRRRHRFLRVLARRVANDALSWQALAGEFSHGAQSARVRQILRREVSGVLDTTFFKVTLQWLIGPEALVEVKRSAQEKAQELMASTPVSAALQEKCREEIERTLIFAADQDHGEAYAAMWREVMARAWKILPPLLAAGGFALGLAGTWLMLPG